jgi:hypothetical protein
MLCTSAAHTVPNMISSMRSIAVSKTAADQGGSVTRDCKCMGARRTVQRHVEAKGNPSRPPADNCYLRRHVRYRSNGPYGEYAAWIVGMQNQSLDLIRTEMEDPSFPTIDDNAAWASTRSRLNERAEYYFNAPSAPPFSRGLAASGSRPSTVSVILAARTPQTIGRQSRLR